MVTGIIKMFMQKLPEPLIALSIGLELSKVAEIFPALREPKIIGEEEISMVFDDLEDFQQTAIFR